MKKLILSIILALALALSTTGGAIFASDDDDDSGASSSRTQLEDRQSDNRDSDDEENSNVTRSTTVNGTITSLSSSRITIDGIRIRLNRQTRIQGVLNIGATVQIKASRTDDSLVAQTITVVTPGTIPPPPPPPVITIPAAPSGLTATASSSTQVNLAWTDNSNNETGFKLQRATDSGFTAGLTTISVGAGVISYSNTGLTASTTYYYRVLATNTAGDSVPSGTATATTQTPPPPPPTPTNQAPVLGTIGNKSVNEGQLLTFTLSATDPDGGTLTYSISNLPSGSTFDATTRVFSWTPSFTQAGSFAAVHFQVSDGSLTDVEDITITVVNVNRAPVLGAIGSKSVNTGALLTFTLSATDPDGGTLTYSASNWPSGASFNATTRVFSWTPSSSQAGSYPAVHFQVSDGSLTDSEDITITVTAAVQLVSFSATILPMMNQYCNSCHSSTAPRLNTYANVYAARNTLPGMGSSYLTTAQEQTLATWISQGAPNN